MPRSSQTAGTGGRTENYITIDVLVSASCFTRLSFHWNQNGISSSRSSRLAAPAIAGLRSLPIGPDAPKSDAPVPKESTATSTPPSATRGGIAVQVGAFADAKVAADLVAALKSKGFSAYTEGVPTTRGTVQRVRVGPFAARGDAEAAAEKLKAAGYDRALVTPAK